MDAADFVGPVRLTGSCTRQTVDGLEKWCPRCSEWWPADSEYFWLSPKSPTGLFYCCKACYHQLDKRKSRRGLVPLYQPVAPEVLELQRVLTQPIHEEIG